MVLAFLEQTLRRPVGVAEATGLFPQAAGELEGRYPALTPRLLDYLVRNYQRGASKPVPPRTWCAERPSSACWASDLRIGGADSGAASVYDVRDIWGGRERGQARSRSRTESALHPTARCGSMTTATHGSWSTA